MKAKTLLTSFIPPVFLFLARILRWKCQSLFVKKKLSRFNKLHLACGNNFIEGWGNIDISKGRNPRIIIWDLTMPLTVLSNTVRLIYSEHFIEHLNLDQGKRLIRECYRILQPGGVLRISTPSLKKIIDEYKTQLNASTETGSSPIPSKSTGKRYRGINGIKEAMEEAKAELNSK